MSDNWKPTNRLRWKTVWPYGDRPSPYDLSTWSNRRTQRPTKVLEQLWETESESPKQEWREIETK